MRLARNLKWFFSAYVLTIILVRTVLSFSPFLNLNLASYNLHHLYPGALLVIISVVYVLGKGVTKMKILCLGVGSALVIDEIVYLIATDGSDLAYLSSISWWGMLLLSILVFVLALFVSTIRKR